MLEDLVNNFVRPHRWRYSLSELGPIATQYYQRHDFQVANLRGLNIKYSYYENSCKSGTCLVYAHCNSGSRLEGLMHLKYFLEAGWNIMLFDFSGSGMSEGQTISLGFRESEDLAAIVSEVRKLANRRLLLWGRSMGASTILRYLQTSTDKDFIYACVLDSPFSDLWKLGKQAGEKITGIPACLLGGFLGILDRQIQSKEGFSIEELKLESKMNRVQCPVLFLVSRRDSKINFEHSLDLFKGCSGVKQITYIEEDHSELRSESTVMEGINFLKRYSDKPKSRIFVDSKNSILKPKLQTEVQDECVTCDLTLLEDFTKQDVVRNPFQPHFGKALRQTLQPYVNIVAEALDFSIRPRKKIFG